MGVCVCVCVCLLYVCTLHQFVLTIFVLVSVMFQDKCLQAPQCYGSCFYLFLCFKKFKHEPSSWEVMFLELAGYELKSLI